MIYIYHSICDIFSDCDWFEILFGRVWNGNLEIILKGTQGTLFGFLVRFLQVQIIIFVVFQDPQYLVLLKIMQTLKDY